MAMDPKVQEMLQALRLDSETLAAQLRGYSFEQLMDMPNAVMRDTLGFDTRTRLRIITYFSMFRQAKLAALEKNPRPHVAAKSNLSTPKKRKSAPESTDPFSFAAGGAVQAETPTQTPPHRRKRTPRSPNTPKRNMTAYFVFAQKMRPEVIMKNPGIDLVSASHELGRLWREMPESEKAEYRRVAAEDLERYRKETAKTA